MGMVINDLKKECQYCCLEIDASGLEGFRCTNRTAIKTTGSSWCYPKNADEPCSKCGYCKPKEEMKMTVDEAEKHLSTYSSTLGSGQTTQEQHEEAKRVAKDIMCKYKEIQEIADKWKGEVHSGVSCSYDRMEDIWEVLDDKS